MRAHSNRSHQEFNRSFRPRCENLEDRLCLSATVSTISVGGVHELRIMGDSGADTVNISDQGDGSVTVTDGSGTTLGTGTNIGIISFNGRNGTDTVNYTLTNSLANAETVNLTLGSGGADTANVDLSAGLNANLNLLVTGGPKSDTISTTLGSLTSSHLNMDLNGGAGNDTISVSGPSVVGTTVGSPLGGRLGNIVSSAISQPTGAVDIDANSSLDFVLSGGLGNDTLSTNFQTQLLGKLNMAALGGAGNDTLATNVTLDAGSTGTLNALSDGLLGTDNVTLNIPDLTAAQTSSTLAAVDAAIVDLTGNDTLTNTPNVKEITSLL